MKIKASTYPGPFRPNYLNPSVPLPALGRALAAMYAKLPPMKELNWTWPKTAPVVSSIAMVAAIAAGLMVMPGQAAEKPSEPVQFAGGRIVNQLFAEQEGIPQSRVVRVVYPSYLNAQR